MYYIYDHKYNLLECVNTIYQVMDILNVGRSRACSVIDKKVLIGNGFGYYVKRHKINLVYKDLETIGHCEFLRITA